MINNHSLTKSVIHTEDDEIRVGRVRAVAEGMSPSLMVISFSQIAFLTSSKRFCFTLAS